MNKAPFRLLPFPDGKEFAVTFVDDTDMSTRENTQPVYEFLHSLNFRGTKTVWPLRQSRSSSFRREDERSVPHGNWSGSTLEDPEYLSFVLDLKARGFEIALHGVAAGNSFRDEIIAGLDLFRNVLGHDPVLNDFHATNIDNLYAGWHKLDIPLLRFAERYFHNSDYQGHVVGSPYFWGDIIQSRIKYVRLPFHTIPFPNTLKLNPSMPFHDPLRPFVNYWFASSDGSDCERFVHLLSERNINSLRRERGVCLIYTHFAKGFFRKDKTGGFLDSAFVRTLERISKCEAGWFPTASVLLDRLLALRKLSITQKGYQIGIENKSENNLSGLTVITKSGITWEDQDGNKYDSGATGILVLESLPAGRTLLLHSSEREYFTVPSRDAVHIPRQERLTIELSNYYGLLLDHLRNYTGCS